MVTHTSILAWRIPWREEPGRLYMVHRVTRSWTQLWVTNILTFHHRYSYAFLSMICLISVCCFRYKPLWRCALHCFYLVLLFLLFSLLFSHSVMPSSLQPHGLQHTRFPCPSPSPGGCSNSCPFSWWCHPTISSSVVPFSCLWSCPASGSFLMSHCLHIRWPKYWSFSFSISPSNEYSGLIFFRIDWFHLLADQGTLKSLQNQSSKAAILQCSVFSMVQLSHTDMTTEKEYLTLWIIVGKVISLLFIMLSRLVITFLPRSKCL